jgi:cytochrome b561
MFTNTPDQYGLIARVLHWLVFLLVAGMLIGGALLNLLPSGSVKSALIAGHKSVGVIVLILMLARLAWRSVNPAPQPLGREPVLIYIAHLLHIVLYSLLIIQPLAGILMSQAYGYPVSVFGLFRLPSLIWQSPSLGAFFGEVHTVTAVLLTIAVLVHAAAALKHHYVDQDRTLMRMLHGR